MTIQLQLVFKADIPLISVKYYLIEFPLSVLQIQSLLLALGFYLSHYIQMQIGKVRICYSFLLQSLRQ